MSLAVRSTMTEEMDGPYIDADTYATCLSDLAALNRVTLTHRPALQWLKRGITALPRGKTVSILDVAYGHGDLLRAIGHWAGRSDIAVRLGGLDLNPRSAAVARKATPPGLDIDYLTGDVFDFQPLFAPDFIVTSQFTHHLTDDEVVRLLAWMDRTARHGWCIVDLQRHGLAYYGFPVLSRIAGWHRIVRQDGRISIARGFRRAEWESLVKRAGLAAKITWSLPFRYCVTSLK